ncbi:PREDICTED: pentatricopeptide repeat-containing protein At2g15980 [Ipomoea nil]|uniref:pentatricopeptide repeat-containing protein At2g15980 n=1 Tax=Ipomoea nil TaxID=35883 RepID=UPI000900BBE5|nr:PREDICTED: pentatricopeptide repeat-containing protein At2g15980 [Ipomoea nil]
MSLFSILAKRVILSIPNLNRHSYFAFSSSPHSDQSIVSAAVSILKHRRSKSRWSHLRSVPTPATGFTPSQVSQIVLQIRNKPHLAHTFFLFTIRHSLCSHSLASYATIIHVLSRSRLKSEALTLIKSAIRKFPDTHSSNPPPVFETLVKTYRACDSAPFVFDLLISAYLESKRVDQSIEILRILKSKNLSPKVATCNSLVELVSKTQGCFAGYDMYREIFRCGDGNVKGAKPLVPNADTFNVLMVGFYREGLVEKVEEVWSEIAAMNCEPNAYSYSILMAALSEAGRVDDAMRISEEMGEKGVKRDIVSYNTAIGALCGVGEVERAEEVFREMVMSGVESTCATLEHLIIGYCKVENLDSALLLYKDLCRKGFKLGAATMDALVRVFCSKGRVFEAVEFVRSAVKMHDVVPREKTYETLISSLCEEGEMEEALKLQVEMVGKGYQANLEIYSAFINGFMKQGNEEMAERLRKEMLTTQMTHDS